MYLMNLLGMFDVLTQQEISKVKPYIYEGNCLNITINYCEIEIIKVIQAFCPNYSKIMSVTKNQLLGLK